MFETFYTVIYKNLRIFYKKTILLNENVKRN